jgi:hypothetical protein
MKYAIIVLLSFLLFGCKNNTNKESVTDNAQADSKFTIYKFKIIGLNDTIVSDSIWKMIFKVDGVEELSLNKGDSTVFLKVETEKVSRDEITSEIIARGGKILKTVQ